MIATLKNMESIHESRGVELILVFCYESILLQLVFDPPIFYYTLIISIISGLE